MQDNIKPFEFHGKASEYFKIWIVNIMLSIVTLGIYSAWAKVRNKQYFYANTTLLNSSFDYLAEPTKILKGRLLAFACIMLYSFSSLISPILQGILLLVFMGLFPWIIIKALKFNHYNSAYRSIRFHFDARYSHALWVFIGLPLLSALSLGLAYPYFARERKMFMINHSAYGKSPFKTSATTGQFYSVYTKAAVATILMIGLGFALYKAVEIIIPFQPDSEIFLLPLLMIFLFYPLMMLVYGYIYTTETNLVINHTTFADCQFKSHLKTTTLCWLYFSNIVAIICSVGLLIPWAKIRLTQYRLSCLSLVTETDMEQFIAAEAERADAIGEELGDLLDIDLGL